MKELISFSDSIIAGVAAVANYPREDWVKWGLDRIFIPALIGAVAVYYSINNVQHEQDKNIALLTQQVMLQKELINELKGEVSFVRAQLNMIERKMHVNK